MMKIDQVSMTFNPGTPDENRALKNVSLDVHDGDFVTVIGSNGAGKTTLYNAIAGTYTPTEGRIFIRDIDVTRRYKSLKISLNNKLRDYFRSRLRELDMGLENRLKDNVDLFSGGQRQALTLLMAVLSEPAILLLDEHTAALDPRNAEIVMNLTEKFAKEYNLTVMMITHNMQHAIQYGNRLLMMDSGEIVLDIDNEEKSQLTIDGVVQRFRDIKKKELSNDL